MIMGDRVTDQDSTILSPRKVSNFAGWSQFFGETSLDIGFIGWDSCAVFLDHLKDCLKTAVCDVCHAAVLLHPNATTLSNSMQQPSYCNRFGCCVAKGAGIWLPARLHDTGNGGFCLSGSPGILVLEDPWDIKIFKLIVAAIKYQQQKHIKKI